MRKSEKYPTTKENFDSFRREVRYWQKKLSLNDFDIRFFHKTHFNDACSSCTTLQEDKIALMVFEKIWNGTVPNHFEIKNSGFHETMELFFDDIEELIPKNKRKRSRQLIHAKIYVLEKLLFNPSYKCRFKREPEREGDMQ